MALYIYDLAIDDRKRAAIDLRALFHEVAEFPIAAGRSADLSMKHVARAITHHNALIVPDQLDLHTDPIERLMTIARLLNVPVYNVNTWLRERKQHRSNRTGTAAAASAAPAMQHGAAAAPRPYGPPPPVTTTG